MKKFNFSVDLINDNILKSLLIFSIPILVSNIFQQLYNMADIAIVGHTLGDNSLAAIGASAAIFELIFGFALGIGNGLSMVTARNYGANNKNLLKKSVAGSIVIGIWITMGFMIAIVLMGTLILQYAINGFGYLIIAGHTSARKLMGFCNIPLTTIALALATFVSQNKGANKVDRIRKGVFYANMMDIIFAIGITIFVYLFSKNMIHLMSGSESEIVLHNGSTYLKIASPFFTILGILFNLRYALQALGEKLIPLVSSIIEFFGKIIFVIFIVPKLGYFGVMICEPLIWIVMVGQLGIAFYGNGYVRERK